MTESQHEQQHQPRPRIVMGEGVDPSIGIDRNALSETMQELGISENVMNNATVVVDPNNRLLNYGTHYSKREARLRFPGLRNTPGQAVRVSAKVRGKERTEKQMNRTLVHELEHVAQSDRRDKKVTAGHVAIWGLTAAGALAGNRIGKNKASKTLGIVVGAIAGNRLGYLGAPHERQARARAREVRTTAIHRK